MVGFTDARSEMCEHFATHWAANASGIVGYTPEIRYPRVIYKNPINPSVHWGRLSIQSVTSNLAAHGSIKGEKKKYEESGLIFIQLFGPISEVEGGEEQEKFAEIARAAFRGKSLPGKVWFRNARINDLDAEDAMLRLNVVAEYEYNEIA